jgi:hypothetical protein
MTCPQFYFNHQPAINGIPFSTSLDLTISTQYLQTGLTTNVCVKVHDANAISGNAVVALYWAGYNSKSMDALHQINNAKLVTSAAVPGNSSATLQFSWEPAAADNLTADPTNPTQLVLFAQVSPAAVVGPNGCNPPTDLNFNPASPYNAAQVFSYLPIPFGEALVVEKSFATLRLAESSLAAATITKDVAQLTVAAARETALEAVAFARRAKSSRG